MSDYYGDHGLFKVCPVCKRAFYIIEPDVYVYKRDVHLERNHGKMLYFDKYSCKRKFDSEYEDYLRQMRSDAAIKRHENKAGRPKGQTRPSKPKKVNKEAEGKYCIDCRYASKDNFGFWYCSFYYAMKAYKPACQRFKPADQTDLEWRKAKCKKTTQFQEMMKT